MCEKSGSLRFFVGKHPPRPPHRRRRSFNQQHLQNELRCCAAVSLNSSPKPVGSGGKPSAPLCCSSFHVKVTPSSDRTLATTAPALNSAANGRFFLFLVFFCGFFKVSLLSAFITTKRIPNGPLILRPTGRSFSRWMSQTSDVIQLHCKVKSILFKRNLNKASYYR